MKTTSIKVMGYRLWVMGVLVLLSIGQANAVDYQNRYKGQNAGVQSTAFQSTAMAPTAGFQSTSAYSGQWQGAGTTPMLNSDGTVNGEAYMSSLPGSSIRRAPGGGPGSSPGTPGGELDPNAQQPIGDALLPLLVMAVAFVLARSRRIRAKQY